MIMKIRLTIMVENNKHLDEKYSKEWIEQKNKRWMGFCFERIGIIK